MTQTIEATTNVILPGRLTVPQIATLINASDPPCERTVLNLMRRHGVGYVKVVNRRLYDLEEVRAALVRSAVSFEPRKPGRPASGRAAR